MVPTMVLILKRIIKLLVFIFSILLILLKLTLSKNELPKIISIKKDERIGTLIIEKINLKEDLYSIDSPHNNIEEHISILKESIPPDKNNSIMMIAAHSGTADISYFKNLHLLQLYDEIILIYDNKTYYYQVAEIWKEKKNGYIHINRKKQKQLILTTCDPTQKDYQLILSCTEKES